MIHLKALQQDIKPDTQPAVQNQVELDVLEPQNPSRRAFIKAGLMTAGGLALGFNLPSAQKAYAQTAQKQSQTASSAKYPVQAWLQLNEDGQVVLIVPAAEMGQGSQTALAMIFADELGADYHKIAVKMPLNDSLYNNPIIGMQVTGGSTAVRAWWQPLSEVAATLRQMLIEQAAESWQVKASQCQLVNHQITCTAINQSMSLHEALPGLEKQAAPAKIALKKPEAYRYIGKPMHRVDTAKKINGSAQFGMDVQLPGLLVATIKQSPVFGGQLKDYDEAAAKAISGVQAIVPLDGAVAVVANGYWAAKQGLEKLKPVFSGGETLGLNTQKIEERLFAGLQKQGETVQSAEDVVDYAHQVEATFSVPYLAHTTMEPMNATAWVRDSQCDVWAPTQNQTQAAQVAADVSLLQPDQVTIHTTYLGGGFGRRANVDYVAQAVALSTEMGAPVKLIWSREEDIQHDFYRPAAVAQFVVKTDQQGMPLAWQNKVVTDSVMANFGGGSDTMIDNAMSEGLNDQEYQLKALSLQVVRENLNIPIGFWRSVGHSFTGFFIESMLNQLAHQFNHDPIDYRLALLADDARMTAVLKRLRSFANWAEPANPNVGKGMASVHSFGSSVAQVVEARLDGNKIKVDRVHCVVDCGKIVNPEIVKRQMSSAIIYGLTAALQGKIEFENGQVTAQNFGSYPMLTLAETPSIHVDIIESYAAPGGYGEPGLPPIAPALSAAITQLTGEYYANLPLKV